MFCFKFYNNFYFKLFFVYLVIFKNESIKIVLLDYIIHHLDFPPASIYSKSETNESCLSGLIIIQITSYLLSCKWLFSVFYQI